MPLAIIAAITATCLAATGFAQPAFAQHYHGHHHLGHGHGHGHEYHYSGDHYSESFHKYGDYHHGHLPHSLHYLESPVLDVYPSLIPGSTFNQGYGNFDTVCPNEIACPLQYQTPPPLASPYQPTTPYAVIPNQRSIPYDQMNPDDPAGHDHSDHDHGNHDHSDHSHDGHDHGSPSLPPSNLPGTFDSPDRHPMTTPTLPERERLSEPPARNAVPDVPETNNGSIRMNEPPPPSLTLTASKPFVAGLESIDDLSDS